MLKSALHFRNAPAEQLSCRGINDGRKALMRGQHRVNVWLLHRYGHGAFRRIRKSNCFAGTSHGLGGYRLAPTEPVTVPQVLAKRNLHRWREEHPCLLSVCVSLVPVQSHLWEMRSRGGVCCCAQWGTLKGVDGMPAGCSDALVCSRSALVCKRNRRAS